MSRTTPLYASLLSLLIAACADGTTPAPASGDSNPTNGSENESDVSGEPNLDPTSISGGEEPNPSVSGIDPGNGNLDTTELCAEPAWPADAELSEVDAELKAMITEHELLGDPRLISREPCIVRQLPSIDSPMAQLGKELFFSKSLSGNLDSACASCHHPTLGGADALSLPFGVGADDPDMLGPLRTVGASLQTVPRNSPTTFNSALLDGALFWDGRVEALDPVPGLGGAGLALSTPDTGFSIVDERAGENLLAAQAKHPILSPDEMLGATFGVEADGPTIRDQLAERMRGEGPLGASVPEGAWLSRFLEVCESDSALPESFAAACQVGTAEALVTMGNVTYAIGEYERTQIFVDTPWRRYVLGDLDALSPSAKEGALLFYRTAEQGGADCGACHTGDLFTDEKYHAVAFPQIGPGKDSFLDLGRSVVTSNPEDDFHFRTPTLLNLATSAPYGHAGTYADMELVMKHYANPRGAIDEYFNIDGDQPLGSGWCQLPEYAERENCDDLFSDRYDASLEAMRQVVREQEAEVSDLPADLELSTEEILHLVSFMDALNDPCTQDDSCLEPWLVDTSSSGPDGHQLNFTHTYPEPTPSVLSDLCTVASADDPTNDTIFYSKAFTWLTGPLESFEYLPVGKLFNYFGFAYFRYVEGPEFEATAQTDGNFRNVASTLALEMLTLEQRERLYELSIERSNLKALLEQERTQVIAIMHQWRLSTPSEAERDEVRSHVLEAYRLEAEVSYLDAVAFQELIGTVTPEQQNTFVNMRSGNLLNVPLAPGVLEVDPDTGIARVVASDAIRREVNAYDFGDTEGADLVGEVASKFVSWVTGSKCKNDYLADGRIANLFGFPAFRIAVREVDPEAAVSGLRSEAANAIRNRLPEAETTRIRDEVLAEIGVRTQEYYEARGSVVNALMAFQTPNVPAAEPDAVLSTMAQLGAAEAEILLLAGETYGEISRGLGPDVVEEVQATYDAYVQAPIEP